MGANSTHSNSRSSNLPAPTGLTLATAALLRRASRRTAPAPLKRDRTRIHALRRDHLAGAIPLARGLHAITIERDVAVARGTRPGIDRLRDDVRGDGVARAQTQRVAPIEVEVR